MTIKRFAWEGAENRSTRTRNVAGQVRPILDGFVEPAGTPWSEDLKHCEPAGRA